MKTERDFLNDLWGIPESARVPLHLEKSEWSPRFERLMRNRLIMGAFRYGPLNDPHKRKFDRMETITRKAALYAKTGNDEFLVDIANMALLEFEEGGHPQKHFKATDDLEHTLPL